MKGGGDPALFCSTVFMIDVNRNLPIFRRNDLELSEQANGGFLQGRLRPIVPRFCAAGLEAARNSRGTSLADLAELPSNRLEALKGDRTGQYSIRINQQWRICFERPQGAPGPSNVEIVDYHS